MEGIDFSYGERYVADRRPFFSEGGNVYQLGTYFHSRRIRDMDGGVNLFGELGKNTSVGTLGMYHRHPQNVIVRASQSFSATSHLSAVFLHITGEMHRQTASDLCPAVCQGKVAMETTLAQSWAGEAVGNVGDITFSYNDALGQPCLSTFLSRHPRFGTQPS